MRTYAATAATVMAVTAVTALAAVVAGPAPAASAAEVQVSLTTSTTTFYPPVDGYRDLARFTVRTDRASTLSLQVRAEPASPVLRTVAIGARPAGRHAATWDARDDLGDLVDPGVYVVRAVATRPGRPTQRTAYTSVRMSWRQLAPRRAGTSSPPPPTAWCAASAASCATCPPPRTRCRSTWPSRRTARSASPGGWRRCTASATTHPASARRPRSSGPTSRGGPRQRPRGYGSLGLETWLDQGDESGWEWYFDSSSGDDGIVQIDTGLRHHQDTERAVRYSFSGVTGDDYVLEDFVVDLTWQVLVAAPTP